KKADKEIQDINNTYKKTLKIETFKKLPDSFDDVDRENKKACSEFFHEWAKGNAKKAGIDGIYVLIAKDKKFKLNHWVEVVVDPKTLKKAFPPTDRNELAKYILDRLKEGKNDEALLGTVNQVRDTLRAHRGSSPDPSSSSSKAQAAA